MQNDEKIMLTPKSDSLLLADKPIVDPEHDRLGYATFARHLAESICKMAPPEGLVVAIYGPWGSGKTSLLNLVVHYLQEKPESEQPIIVRFNPWWFSGHEDLTKRFFAQLQAVLSKSEVMEKLRKKLAIFAELISEAPIPYASIAKTVAGLLEDKDVFELKTDITKALKEQQKRIWVIIDDIDRLTSDEIRQLFRLVKAVADFPNIVYLLAFDREVVVKAVEQMQDSSGEAYLEKIVQVPFELPLPDKTSLRKLLFERLQAILADIPDELFDQTYWGNVYLDGIEHFITTPRDIIRLTNTLSVTYHAVKGEVNPVDFIAVETLRVFCPLAYDIIRKNRHAFAGHADTTDVDGLESFHNEWIEEVQKEDREPVKRLLMRIFPKLEVVWGNFSYGAEWESTWRKQLRVCSADIFPVYFRLAIPEGSISNTEMKALLALAGDAKAFGAKLVELANQKRPEGTTRVRAFLERLEDYTKKDIPSDSIPSILQALFDVGDQLLRPEDEPRGVLDFGNDIRITRIIWQLLSRLDEPERFKVLKEAISNGKAVTTIVREVATLGQQHGKYGADQPAPEEDRLISAQHLQELEKIALEKIRNAAKEDILLQAPDLLHILYRWRDWAGEEEPKKWVQKVVSDDKKLVEFLEKSLQRTFRFSSLDAVGQVQYRLDPEWLRPFLDPSEIIDRVRRLFDKGDLSENQKIALRQFIQEYEIRQRGMDPNDPLAWEAK